MMNTFISIRWQASLNYHVYMRSFLTAKSDLHKANRATCVAQIPLGQNQIFKVSRQIVLLTKKP